MAFRLRRRMVMRWHVWLGWLIGVPLLLWTASGLFMASFPIDTIRGEHLKAETLALPAIRPVAPMLQGRAVQTLTLAQQAGQPVWLIDYADGGKSRADARSGRLLPMVSAREAGGIARSAFAGDARLIGVTRFSADAAPLELRRPRPSWQARFDDGTHLYVDAETGAVLATRSALWRVFDFMWGLHIMDLQTREDTNHPILIGFAALAVVSILIGIMLLPLRRTKGRSAPQGLKPGNKG
ncbi:PepSY domain-containing protein [Blastomonas sp. AAP53]|uniref:PepSY domain-containing protein n=1 Tax=Blastomonas sp. AAP53 TaxID=1248760 RepID=UPI00058B13FE|nr:PepSY domain-containing protein [Blastomonas sp. AAP53]